jgi:hypothetical protein
MTELQAGNDLESSILLLKFKLIFRNLINLLIISNLY